MLEGLVAWVLNTYIGDYVELVNTSQLTVGLLQGQVELDNIPFKKDALLKLDLPLEVKSGVIGRICLRIPLKRLRSEPWVITLENLNLVITPLKLQDEKFRKSRHDRKQAQLKALEEKWKITQSSGAPAAVDSSSWWSYGTSMLTNIVENLQLNVRNCQVRYEDDITVPGHSFAVGFTIQTLAAQSTDSDWVPKYVSHSSTEMMFKLLELQGLSLYWDCFEDRLHDEASVSNQQEHDYILEPVNAKGKLCRLISPLPIRDVANARLTLDVVLDKIVVELRESQYQNMVACLDALNTFEIKLKYLRLRPFVAIQGNANQWWQFAAEAMLRRNDKLRHTFRKKDIISRAKDVNSYVLAYKTLITQGASYVNPTLQANMERVEGEWTFDDVRLLREAVRAKLTSLGIKVSAIKEAESDNSSVSQSRSWGGVLYGWFPGWSGWYGQSRSSSSSPQSESQSIIGSPVDDPQLVLFKEQVLSDAGTATSALSSSGNFRTRSLTSSSLVTEQSSTTLLPSETSTEEIEKELQGVQLDTTETETLFKRDAVLARVSCTFDGFDLQLLQNNSSNGSFKKERLMDVECVSVKIDFESRPRTNGMKLSLAVGGFKIQDYSTPGTQLPFLVTSHPRVTSSGQTAEQMLLTQCEATLLRLTYERNPWKSTASNRLEINSRPLDIVYNPHLFKRLQQFFKVNEETSYKRDVEFAVKHQYSEWRSQTKLGLQHTLVSLLEDDEQLKSRKWDVTLEIAAPRFIIPESITDEMSPVFIFDLGNINLCSAVTELEKTTAPSQTMAANNDEEDNDEFQTPPSTPPNEPVSPDEGSTNAEKLNDPEFNEEIIRNKLYDKYSMALSDVHLMICGMKETWRQAGIKTTNCNIIDKFSITLQLERRLMQSSDASLPKLTLSGTLPNLNMHLSESKLISLQKCLNHFILPSDHTTPSAPVTSVKSSRNLKLEKSYIGSAGIAGIYDMRLSEGDRPAEAHLILMQFAIRQLSIAVLSGERSLAELQVTGMKAEFSQKSQEISVAFSLHSLLVVDAVQTFGPDFDLLVTSHKRIGLDSHNGTMFDFNISSPSSGQTSPQSSYNVIDWESCSQNFLSKDFVPQLQSGNGQELYQPEALGELDGEPLIRVELDIVQSPDASVNLLNIQFSNLDIIANQVTIAELMTFVRRIMLVTTSKKPDDVYVNHSNAADVSAVDEDVTDISPKKKTDISTIFHEDVSNHWTIMAEFRHVNVLLVNAETTDQIVTSLKKLAVASLSEARIKAELKPETVEVGGSIGGLQLSDLLRADQRYSKVISIGQDSSPSWLYQNLQNFLLSRHHNTKSSKRKSNEKALSFTAKRNKQSSVLASDYFDQSGATLVSLELELASVYYTHSPIFIKDLSQCLVNFKEYLSTIGTSLRHVAAEMAIGLMRPDNNQLAEITLNASASNIETKETLAALPMFVKSSANKFISEEDLLSRASESSSEITVRLNAKLRTPVIVIPSAPQSSSVLLGYPGEITIRNFTTEEQCVDILKRVSEDRTVYIELQNISMFSVELNDLQADLLSFSEHEVDSPDVLPSGYTELLHDTAINLELCKGDVHSINETNTFNFSIPQDQSELHCDSLLIATGRFVSPLSLSLTKSVYTQILKTLDNLAPAEEAIKVDSSYNFSFKDAAPSFAASDISKQNENVLAVQAEVVVPMLQVIMKDVIQGEFASLKLEQLGVKYEKNDTYTKSIQLQLQSLTMEDLLESSESPHRCLMLSYCKNARQCNSNRYNTSYQRYVSTSCPNSEIDFLQPPMPRSLPSSFLQHNVFDFNSRKAKKLFRKERSSKSCDLRNCPDTPPPSPTACDSSSLFQNENTLLNIKILLVDRQCPEFVSKYNEINRFIDIDFSCLDTTFSLDVWVLILDFLGMGPKETDSEQTADATKSNVDYSGISGKVMHYEAELNSFITMKVESLSLLLNKREYELAKASIAQWSATMTITDGDLNMQGRLGNISLNDLSPFGANYKCKFITIGSQALDFDFMRYGNQDPDLQRNCDLSVRVQMSSVYYIHTQRFVQELLAFMNNFNYLQDTLGHIRASSSGKKLQAPLPRGNRLKLNIEAGSPLIIIPQSATSNDLLVLDLGTLVISNTFLFSGTDGTLGARDREPLVSMDAIETFTDTNDIMSASVYGDLANDWRVEQTQKTTQVCRPQSLLQTSFDSDFRTKPFNVMTIPIRSLSQDANLMLLDDSQLVGNDVLLARTSPLSSSSMSASFHTAVGSIAGPSYPSKGTGSNVITPVTAPVESDLVNDADLRSCLLDVMKVELIDMDVFSAERLALENVSSADRFSDSCFLFPSFAIKRQQGKMLQTKCHLQLQVERNLESQISHAVPDMRIAGALSSLYFAVDLNQYTLIRGILGYNFGEVMDDLWHAQSWRSYFRDIRPSLNVEQVNKWISMSISMELVNVTAELLIAHEQFQCNAISLAKINLIKSKLIYMSFSDSSKDIDLVSHEIAAYDTRYNDEPANVRPNVFHEVLKPMRHSKSSGNVLQMELHCRLTKAYSHYTVLLNNMRLMAIFDWLMAVQDFIMTAPKDLSNDGNTTPVETSGPASLNRSMSSVSGIMTKRVVPPEPVTKPFELKLNCTSTELVIVESAKDKDTNAIILKATAVVAYRPQSAERLLSCSIQSVELFSCCLNAEDETALSIIDPFAVTVELCAANLTQKKSANTSGGLQAVTDVILPVLDISFEVLNIRLSYNDMKLLAAIMTSVKLQLAEARRPSEVLPRNHKLREKYLSTSKNFKVRQLEQLGYSGEDCQRALDTTDGDMDSAAIWLTENASHISLSSEKTNNSWNLSGLELKAETICLCLIDDCQDLDVPLAEVTLSDTYVFVKLPTAIEGNSQLQFAVDYYNRSLSGWEPLVEQWKCHLIWNSSTVEDVEKMIVRLEAADILNITLTSAFIDLYKRTSTQWHNDYFKSETDKQLQIPSPVQSKRRMPFIPYAIRNLTGCKLWFRTMISTPSRIATVSSPLESVSKISNIAEFGDSRLVLSGEEVAFAVGEQDGKIRHKYTHVMQVHKVIVQVDGWQELQPVSIDKVGTFFRHARARKDDGPLFKDTPSARVVFDIKMEGSAKKIITVRSSLTLVNKLQDDLEVKIQNLITGQGHDGAVMCVSTGNSLAVPLTLVHCNLLVRPTNWSLDWCNSPINWQQVTKADSKTDGLRYCYTINADSSNSAYRFCVQIYRQPFPEEKPQRIGRSDMSVMCPGHVITFVPALRVENLLPMDLAYYFVYTDISGTVKPGMVAPVVAADISQPLEFGVHLESFPTCREIVIPPGTQDYKVKLRLYDSRNFLLELWVHIKEGIGGSMQLRLWCPYWLINRSGLPLVFRQESTNQNAAGQFEEHEIARCVAPLLFCYTEKDKPFHCSMRVGKSLHGIGKPHWCHRFSLERGNGFRELHVTTSVDRPDWVYNIGIVVRQGRGRYQNTNIVTFSPRYQLENRSSHKLAFVQKHIIEGQSSKTDVDYLLAMPSCTLPFHWPRVDRDQLLCVRMVDVPDCRWSGGFPLNSIVSFTINMRGKENKCLFLHVDVVLQGATFFAVFTDADQLPTPYRIDNLSEVPVQYYQTKVADDSLRSFIGAHTKVSYAWDEFTMDPFITLRVQGGTSATYNLDVLGDGDQLCYDNFIYIAFADTFKSCQSAQLSSMSSNTMSFQSFFESQQLVLDVLPDKRVVLKKKEGWKRSQLWKMSSGGLLCHEGSSVPRDPRNPLPDTSVPMVLDIADIALRPNTESLLKLRRADEKRHLSQRWHFTEGGQLCCGMSSKMCVQAKDGRLGLRDGGEVVVGPAPVVKGSRHIPSEILIERQKLRPGSGVLNVKVVTDGPTRVLQITDINDVPRVVTSSGKESDWIVVEQRTRTSSDKQNPKKAKDEKSWQLPTNVEFCIFLNGGIGISLVNHLQEEIVYIALRGIEIALSCERDKRFLDFNVAHFQIDNQLAGTYETVVLYSMSDNKALSPDEASPSLDLHCCWSNKLTNQTTVFEYLYLTPSKLIINLEEKCCWKLMQFFGFGVLDVDLEKIDECSADNQKAVLASMSSSQSRYYFGCLKIRPVNMSLSMISASELSPDVKLIKKSMGIPFVKFEDARVELDAFEKCYLFETSTFLRDTIMLHYTNELKSQAARILGSVDFLGNPLGLFSDVTEGISGFIDEGNIGGLIKNITHGVTNTAAKVTGAISDGISKATFDPDHQRTRRQIRQEYKGAAGGLQGLGLGIMGGVTSIFKQSYTGYRDDGVSGFVRGFGKGVVGTVTKPVTGMLDFAAGTASAVRDSRIGRSSQRHLPRIRAPRCSRGIGGLLPVYNKDHADAQQLLYSYTENDVNEVFMFIDELRRSPSDPLLIMVSSLKVYFMASCQPRRDSIILELPLTQIFNIRYIAMRQKHWLEMTVYRDDESSALEKIPNIRCDTAADAQNVAQRINYTKSLFEETRFSLPDIRADDEW